jgi:hypothetical protein
MLERIALRARQTELNRRRKSSFRKRLQLESLESRLLMTANSADPSEFTLSHGSGVCHCPVCTGKGLELVPAFEAAATVSGTSTAAYAAINPLSALPQLSSRPEATAKVYLDFNGHTEAAWGEFRNVVTPAYDIDGDRNSFSATELTNIEQIWARVAEDYAPFNIDVTTILPASFANKVAVRVAIGGNHSDWFGSGAGGVAYIGGFYNSASNVAYVFEDALGNGNPRYVAEAASHEAGHTFGLLHQSVWSGNTLVDSYNEGNSSWAPIMGVGYYSARTTWHNGPTENGPNAFQDDMSILANASNGFGYRADDHGSPPDFATVLSGNTVNIAGVIEQSGDLDMFRFTTTGGTVNLSVNVAQVGANLDAELRIRTYDGTILAMSDPSNSLNATISTTLAAGTYYAVVRGSTTTANQYGNVGTYTLTGSIGGGSTTPSTAPEIGVAVAGVAVADGGSVSFGSTTVGTAVDRVFTITNSGNAPLSLTAINTASLPAGFSLVSNIPTSSLAAGASTSFTIRLNAATAGNFGGAISIANSDGDEGQYNLTLSGNVSAPVQTAVVRTIDNGASGFSTTGYWIRRSGMGRDSDYQYAARGTGSTTATWNFTGLPAGTYRVYATYPASQSFASNAPFQVFNGATRVGTAYANQRVLPSTTIDGSRYQLLGTYTITGSQLVVRLNNAANGYVVADAIRIEQVTTSSGAIARSAPLGNSAGPSSAAAALASPIAAEAEASSVSRGSSMGLGRDQLNAAVEQLTNLSARLQNPVSLRAIDHFFTTSNSLPTVHGSGSAGGDGERDSLFADGNDWLGLN